MTPLQRFHASKQEKIEPGLKTSQQWAAEWGLADSHTRRTLKQMVDAGIMGVRNVRILLSAGYTRPIPHYYEIHEHPVTEPENHQDCITVDSTVRRRKRK